MTLLTLWLLRAKQMALRSLEALGWAMMCSTSYEERVVMLGNYLKEVTDAGGSVDVTYLYEGLNGEPKTTYVSNPRTLVDGYRSVVEQEGREMKILGFIAKKDSTAVLVWPFES
jgi:hypothetical protein